MLGKYYQPSKKFSIAGLIALVAVFIVIGGALAWVYLWFNRVCTVVLLSIFAAIGYGALMGFLGNLTVKKCKIRNPAVALIGILIGVIGMTYIKWGMYDYYDWQQIAEAQGDYDYVGYLKQENAYTLFEMYYDFDEDYGYTFEENYEYLQNNAYTAIAAMYLVNSADIDDAYSQEMQDEMKNYTLYEWYYYDILLGTTMEECRENLAVAKTRNGYEYLNYMNIDVDDFIEEYYGASTYEVPTLLEILTHPGDLWKDIKYINEEGRWSYVSSSGSGSSATTTDSGPVTGVTLWIVWIGEFLIIDLFAIFIACSQSKKIFIEQDNNWAEVFDGNKLTFANMSKMQLKSMLEQTPDNIMNMAPVDPVNLIGRPYVKLTVSHSRDYSENYLNGYVMTYNSQNKGYAAAEAFRGLAMTPKQTGVLFSMFGIQPMGKIANDPEFISWSTSGGYMNAGGGYAQPAMQSAATAAPVTMDAPLAVCGSCGTQVPAGKKFCPNCGAPFESAQQPEQGTDRISFEAWRNAGGSGSTPSDEMEGISTDNIDTTDL